MYLLKEWRVLQAMRCGVCGRLYSDHAKYPNQSQWNVVMQTCPGGTEREKIRDEMAKKPGQSGKQHTFFVYPEGERQPVLEYDRVRR